MNNVYSLSFQGYVNMDKKKAANAIAQIDNLKWEDRKQETVDCLINNINGLKLNLENQSPKNSEYDINLEMETKAEGEPTVLNIQASDGKQTSLTSQIDIGRWDDYRKPPYYLYHTEYIDSQFEEFYNTLISTSNKNNEAAKKDKLSFIKGIFSSVRSFVTKPEKLGNKNDTAANDETQIYTENTRKIFDRLY